jgi:hypothetical protein
MQPTDAEKLFKQNYPSNSPDDNPHCVYKLLQQLEYLPLAIVQVASYLEMNRCMITPSRYLEIFTRTEEDRQRLLFKSIHNPWRSDRFVTSGDYVDHVYN